MKKYNSLKWGAFAMTGALLSSIFACTPIKKGEYASGSATIFCDEGFKNILEEEIEVFEFTYPNASILPFYVSEQDALDTLLADGTQAAIVTREFTKEEIQFMKSKYKRIIKQDPIAVDAVALIINKDNPVDALSVEEVGKIINGEITNWNQLAGKDTTAIKIVFDFAGSSTVSYLRQRFLPEGKTISEVANAYGQQSNSQVFDIVKNDPNALGVISVSWLGDDLSAAKKVPVETRLKDYSNENDTVVTNLTTEVKILKISNPTEENDYSAVAYAPYQAYIFSGEYPLVRTIYMISAASSSTVMNSFFMFVKGPVGQKIISKTGILPYKMNPRVVQLK